MTTGNWRERKRADLVFLVVGTLVGTALLVIGIEWQGPLSKGDPLMMLLGLALLFSVAWVAVRSIGEYTLSELLDRRKQKKT